MATQLPLRSIRIPALQRQCLFQRSQHLRSALGVSISAARAFSSTPSCPAKRRQLGQDKAQSKAAARAQVQPSPKVNFERAQRDSQTMEEDIGILQNTMIRAPLREFYGRKVGVISSYFWKLVKSKGVALYSRYLYRRCMQKTGWTKFLPIDIFNNAALKEQAQQFYNQLNTGLAAGHIASIEPICLKPLTKKLDARIAARPQGLRMMWKLHKFKSVRIVSHRASPIGEDHPDTAYRQAVIRLESVQSLTRRMGNKANTKGLQKAAWLPDAVREQQEKSRMAVQKQRDENGMETVETHNTQGQFAKTGVKKTVVEYIVLQQRVVQGKPEEWKVWGFTEESTPESVQEDEEYWRRTVDMQASS